MLTDSQAVIISRCIVKYDTRPLVSWTEHASAATPPLRSGVSTSPTSVAKQLSTLSGGDKQTTPRFPIEKLATPKREPEKVPTTPALPAEVDDMDWTPSVQNTYSVQHELRPNVSVYQRNQGSVLDGPLPFYGSLPAAPQPPSWRLFNRPSQKPIEQVFEPNPFHRARTTDSWQQSPDPHEPVFAPPKFFPPTDHADSTGLESLFDRTFTIRSPEDERGKFQQQERPRQPSYRPSDVQGYLLFQYFRLGLLLVSIAAWLLAQNGYIAIPGNYIEVISLGSASLIAGFGLLEVLKQPMVQWNGVEILVYIAELVAAVHLGYNLPRVSLEREYFNRYGKLLLIFMGVQEALGLVFFYQTASLNMHSHQAQQATRHARHGSEENTSSNSVRPESKSPSGSFQSPLPAISSSSTAPASSFSAQPPEPQYQSGFPQPIQGFNENHSFSLKSLKEADSDYSDGLDHDSDTETTMTTATTATNNTIRNIRYGRNFESNEALFSPNRTELGPGIGGLSLDDKPVRMTRSQTQKLRGIGARRYPLGRTK